MLSALNDGGVRSKTLLTRLADQPKSPAIIGVAEVLCEQGHYSEAITRLRSVAEIYGDTYRFNLVLARACRDAGEIELAKQHYEKACQIAPQNEVAIKELIALTAFPQSVPKPALHSLKPDALKYKEYRAVDPPTQDMPEPEIPSTFKLDREKLSKALGGVVGSAEKHDSLPNEAQTHEIQQPTSNAPSLSPSVMEEFRKADDLLEQEPDIDALAREMMGNTFLPNKPIGTSQNDVSGTSSTQAPPPQPPKIATQHQQSMESDADIEAIARQMLGLDISDAPMESATTATPQVAPTTAPPTSSSSPSAPAPIPLDENGNPIIRIDRNKLTQALSGIHKAKGITPSASPADKDEDDEMPFPKPNEATGSRPQEPPPLTSPIESPTQSGGTLSFEEEIMAMQMQGGDIDAFISNKDTAHDEKASAAQQTAAPTSISNDYDIDALAREIMSAQLPKVVETNDPTPIAEQRQPFSDDEEIKMPTRQLAKIFQSQGAYAKAIKVYEMLAEREPENASLYEILISGLREKMNASR
jgi:tetratricopeptide (TPR) repeat protein